MTIRIWHWGLLASLALLIALVYLVLKFPLSLIFSEEMQSLGVTDLSGASISGGELWVSQESIPGLIYLSYAWCPSAGLRTWCVTLESDLASLDAQVTPGGSELRVEDATIRRLSPELFGTVGSLFSGMIKGRVQSLGISSYSCPLQHIQDLSAQLEIAGLQVMGTPMGNHQIAARSAGERIEVVISGESVDGTIHLTGKAYEAEGKLLASGQLEAMARSLMRPLGANRYGWEIDGNIPC